jgi:hypothetical protein
LRLEELVEIMVLYLQDIVFLWPEGHLAYSGVDLPFILQSPPIQPWGDGKYCRLGGWISAYQHAPLYQIILTPSR